MKLCLESCQELSSKGTRRRWTQAVAVDAVHDTGVTHCEVERFTLAPGYHFEVVGAGALRLS